MSDTIDNQPVFRRFDNPWGERPGPIEGYDTAQVCLNGHPINALARSQPQHNQKFCGKCGAKTIIACPACNANISGKYNSATMLDLTPYYAASFCHDCGKPYPWTEGRLKAARDLAGEMEKLDTSEREALSKSLDDLVRETPQTQVAVTRFKKLMTKAGSVAAESFRKILVDVLAETIKKQLWP